MGTVYHSRQDQLGEILPAVLDGLADEAEGVRDAALSAGRTAVELFAGTSLPLLLPAVEAGILNDNWRIRQSSVELLGDLLFKVLRSPVLPLDTPSTFDIFYECRSKGIPICTRARKSMSGAARWEGSLLNCAL